MIYIDVDGVLVDFIGTAKKHFGIELAPNEFGKWRWGAEGYPTAEEFYKVAEPQEWATKLYFAMERELYPAFVTKGEKGEKGKWLLRHFEKIGHRLESCVLQRAPEGKAEFCEHPCDLLIDDNPTECEAWRKKGGIAYWFNLLEQDPFGKFLKWWRMER